MPRLAKSIMLRNEKTREPIAEFKKLTASLLTPTIKSPIARRNKITIRIKYMLSIKWSHKSYKMYHNLILYPSEKDVPGSRKEKIWLVALKVSK